MVYFNQGGLRNLIEIRQSLHGLRDRRFVDSPEGWAMAVGIFHVLGFGCEVLELRRIWN